MTLTSSSKPLYRGYQIEMVKATGHWTVSIHPTRPDLPILRQNCFRPLSIPETEALAQAKRWIDRALSY